MPLSHMRTLVEGAMISPNVPSASCESVSGVILPSVFLYWAWTAPGKNRRISPADKHMQGVFQARARIVSLRSCVARMRKSGWAHSKQLRSVFKAPSLHFVLCILIPSFEGWKHFLFLPFRGGGNMFRKASHQWSNQRNAIHEKINRERNPPVLRLGRFKPLIYISECECKLKG